MTNRQVFILHGWGSSAKRWSAVKQSLEEKGCSVFIPDLPGFGLEPSPENPWSIEDYAGWVNQWTDEKQRSGELVEPFCLAGHSFGGGIAAVFAAKYPQKIDKLILISAAVMRRKTVKKMVFFAVSKVFKIFFYLPLLSKLYPLAQKALYKLVGVTDYITPTIQRSPIMKETFRKIISKDLTSFLPNIQAPTLILWGQEDRVTPLSDAKAIQKGISDSRLEVIPGEDHDINIKAPEKLAEAIAKFLIPNS